jgi:CheY-like chemotaxis protein
MTVAVPQRAHRVLIVDDDSGVQALMKTLLLRRELIVEIAGDGDAALGMLRRQHYDTIVLDLMLPKVNGFEVIRDLKAHAPDLLQRTIVVTAASNLSLRDFRDGTLVRRLLRKPFDIDEFVKEVLSCVDDGDGRAAS